MFSETAHVARQTPAPRPILLSWSGGKDSAWALHLLRQQPQYKVVGLLTTINEKFRRVAIHGFREELLDLQAAATGLPLWKVDLPFPCSNADYESRMAHVLARAVAQGIHGIAFGDLFLEDIRAYRVAQLAPTGLEPIFPVWCASLGLSTAQIAQQMLATGLRAYLTCIDPRALDPSFAGRTFDAALRADLPATIDPCGERGEFHTFAFAGPMFSRTIRGIAAQTVERDNFIYAEILPAPGQTGFDSRQAGPHSTGPAAPPLHRRSAVARSHRSIPGADPGPARPGRLRTEPRPLVVARRLLPDR
ncbi:MAG: ATP-binding protein [Acidobacteriaceae bacterium]|jgi:uncharacterized protein (TIGR00290 family)